MLSAGEQLYPNLYTLLVGTPGSGKTQAIKHTNFLWYAVKDLFIAPHDITKAHLIDCLAGATRKIIVSEIEMIEYNSLQIAADEFGVLLPSHDTEFLSTLNRIFDNPPQHQQGRRSLGKDPIDIINPQLNIVAGTQPSYLANLLPEEAWGQGFMSRVIMVYAVGRVKISIFNAKELNKKQFYDLVARLSTFTKLSGQLGWDLIAAQAAQRWHDDGCPPEPEHSKLEHYNERRMLHALKLSMISAVSAGHDRVFLEDFLRAKFWLLSAEERMPDIFRAMVQRSDIQVIDELHYFMWKIWATEQKPVHQARIYDFLKNRVPSEKIPRILDLMMKANIIELLAGTNLYRPRAKIDHGTE